MKLRQTLHCFVIALLLSQSAWAEVDSVRISGRILHLSAQRYREAPSVAFSRNNLLRPDLELTRLAPLQPDGSFEITLPLIFEQEEVSLDYGGQVFATFLASPGALSITWDADSMFKAKHLFHFAGVHAETNTQYQRFLSEENKILQRDKRLGDWFFKHFWGREEVGARRLAHERAELRRSVLDRMPRNEPPTPMLRQWVTAQVEGEYIRLLLDHALNNGYPLSLDIKSYVQEFVRPPLTLQQVRLASSLKSYAYRRLAPSSRYFMFGTMQMPHLSVLNKLLDNTATPLLLAGYLPAHYPLFSIAHQQLLYKLIRERLDAPELRASLDEVHALEMSDTLTTHIVLTRTDLTNEPKEVLRDIWLAESDLINGQQWLNQIRTQYKGRYIYYIKWSVEDVDSRFELDYLPALRASLPENVLFVYLHTPFPTAAPKHLWKQHVVKKRLEGVHLYLTKRQFEETFDVVGKFSMPAFMLARPGGPLKLRKAPPPSREAQTFEYLNRAIRR